MLALQLEDRPVLVTNAERPRRAPGEALVAVRLAGVCDTDLQLAQGYMGYQGILGHEFVGLVLECDERRWIGKRVVADINAGCGECQECIERGGHHCPTRTVLGILGRGGALAEQLVIPERCLIEVPEGVADEQAVFAEPLAAALHVLDELEEHHDRAIVLGDGKLGLLIAMVLAEKGLDTTLVGHHRDKLACAKGARGVLEDELSAELSAPMVVEATGTAAGLSRALSLCEARGTVVLKSTVAAPHSIDLSSVVINELSLRGSRCGDLKTAVDWLARVRIDPRPLIAARYSLSDAERAMEHAGRKGTLKVLVEVSP